MKKYACQYAIVRFLPYIETGEFANVGIVFLCPETGYFDYKLISRKRRIKAFFEELDGAVYKRAETIFQQELARVKKLLASENFAFPLQKDVVYNVFGDLTHPREGILRFDGITRVVLTENPEQKLTELFSHYVERNFATKSYQEKLLENDVRGILQVDRLIAKYKAHTFGNAYRVKFPFVYMEGASPRKAIKPLSLAYPEPNRIFDYGWAWMGKIEKLKEMHALPEEILIPVQGPQETEGSRIDAFLDITTKLRTTATVVDFRETKKILDYAKV